MAQLKTQLILETSGCIKDTYDHWEEDIPQSKDKVTGQLRDTTLSSYVVYALPHYNKGDASRGYKIIKGTQKEDLGFVARSLRGFDNEGIVLFEYYNFGGPDAYMFTGNCPNVADEFPSMARGEGISSIMVLAGNWRLYTDVGFRGEIPVPGTCGDDYLFREGQIYQLPNGAGNDKVMSVKRIN